MRPPCPHVRGPTYWLQELGRWQRCCFRSAVRCSHLQCLHQYLGYDPGGWPGIRLLGASWNIDSNALLASSRTLLLRASPYAGWDGPRVQASLYITDVVLQLEALARLWGNVFDHHKALPFYVWLLLSQTGKITLSNASHVDGFAWVVLMIS